MINLILRTVIRVNSWKRDADKPKGSYVWHRWASQEGVVCDKVCASWATYGVGEVRGWRKGQHVISLRVPGCDFDASERRGHTSQLV